MTKTLKFSISADALADAATFAGKAISPRPPMPILSGLLIEAVTGNLRISGFDYEESARTQVAADVTTPGSVLLQGRMFTDIIRKFGRKTVTVSVTGSRATLAAGQAEFTMATMPVDQFPPMPALPAVAGTIDGDELAAAVAQVMVAVSKDGTLPLLRGIEVTTEGNSLTLRSTDRYRLAERVVPWNSAGEDLHFVIRGSWLHDISKSLAGEASILHSDNIVGVRTGNRASTAILVDGDYPKIRSLFPDSTPITVYVDRQELADAVGRVSLVAERNTPLRMIASGETMEIDAGTGEDAQGREVLSCEVAGGDVRAAFNPHYLAECLAVIPGPTVHLGFNANMAKPALFRPTDETELRHLVMPVRLP